MAAQAAALEEAAVGAETAAAPVAADSRDAAAEEPSADAREKGEDAGVDGKVRVTASPASRRHHKCCVDAVCAVLCPLLLL